MNAPPINIVPCDRLTEDESYIVSGSLIYRVDWTTGTPTLLTGVEEARVRRWLLRDATEKRELVG